MEGGREVMGGREGSRWWEGGVRMERVGGRPGLGVGKNGGRGQWKKLVTSLFCVVYPNGSTENCGTVSGTIPVKIQGMCVFDCVFARLYKYFCPTPLLLKFVPTANMTFDPLPLAVAYALLFLGLRALMLLCCKCPFQVIVLI